MLISHCQMALGNQSIKKLRTETEVLSSFCLTVFPLQKENCTTERKKAEASASVCLIWVRPCKVDRTSPYFKEGSVIQGFNVLSVLKVFDSVSGCRSRNQNRHPREKFNP